MQKLLNRLVGFQQDTVEEINWKRIWQQLKWMNTFSKGYRGKLAFLTSITIFFTLVGIWYVYIYKDIVNLIMSEYQNVISFVVYAVEQMKGIPLLEKLRYVLEQIPSEITIEGIAALGSFLSISTVTIIVGYFVLKVVTYLYSLFMDFFTLRLSTDLGRGIKRKIYATILEGDWLSLTQYRAGDLVQRATGDAETVSSFAMTTVPQMISQVVQFVVAFAALVTQNGLLTLLAFIGIPLYLLAIRVRGKRNRDYSKRSLDLSSRHSSFLYESMANIMVIKSFMVVPQFIKKYRALHQEAYDLAVERKKYGIVTGAILGMVGRVVGMGMTLFFTVLLIDGKMSMGALAAFGMLSSRVSGPVNAFMGFVMGSIEMSASAERVMTLYELPKDKTQVPETVKAFGERAERDGMGLLVDNLDFAYVKGETVLHDVDIQVSPGETVALVGPSGEGKTTLIRLALGLLVPDKGEAVLVTGRGEKLELSVETREFFSYVPQENALFSGTIRENMEIGNPEATDEMMIHALKLACIWPFIEQLPDGLDSKLGERGVGVSQGQAQRLAIARALLRDAPILLLDEATSALDIYTEKEVLENIFNEGNRKTCILTTHRPSVFNVCDKIYAVRKRSVELIKEHRDQVVSF